MWKKLLSLFSGSSKKATPRRQKRPSADRELRGETRVPVSGPEMGSAAPWDTIDPLPTVENLDAEGTLDVILLDEEADLHLRIQHRIEDGKITLSQLPSTSIAIMELAAKPTAEVEDVVQIIESDPVLSSELLKTANSILYGGRIPTESIRNAVMRIGMRSLRSMILGLSMRSALLREPNVKLFGEKVWRQAFTVASISRSIADRVGFEPERAFLLGLLHDIGKVALLDTLSKELSDDVRVTPALVGRLFLECHELAGRRMAEIWKLSDELVSVAGQHHDFAANEEHPRSAALVSVAHKMELFLSLGADHEFQALAESAEFEVLGISPQAARELLAQGLRTYMALHPAPEKEAEATAAAAA